MSQKRCGNFYVSYFNLTSWTNFCCCSENVQNTCMLDVWIFHVSRENWRYICMHFDCLIRKSPWGNQGNDPLKTTMIFLSPTNLWNRNFLLVMLNFVAKTHFYAFSVSALPVKCQKTRNFWKPYVLTCSPFSDWQDFFRTHWAFKETPSRNFLITFHPYSWKF